MGGICGFFLKNIQPRRPYPPRLKSMVQSIKVDDGAAGRVDQDEVGFGVRQCFGADQSVGLLSCWCMYADHVRDCHQLLEACAPACSDRDLHAGWQVWIMERDLHSEGTSPGGRSKPNATEPHDAE